MKTISKLKKELDKWFSLYIRLRYATPQGGIVKCWTCGSSKLLDIRIGEGTSDNLEELSKVTTKIMRHEYEELITKYKQKVKHEETRLS